jgi:plasmid maintenance system antidote protein VapI
LINGKRNITPNWALLLSVSLSTSLEVWLNLQKNYDVYLLEQTLKDKRKNIKINSIIKKAKIILC